MVTATFDLNRAGEFCAGQLCWEGEALTVCLDGQEQARYALSDAAQLNQRTDIGCGRLELCLKGLDDPADSLPLCRFSMRRAEEIGEFCKAINYYLKYGEAIQPKQEQPRICQKCGRSLLPGMRTCFFCADQRVLWRRAWRMLGNLRPTLLLGMVLMLLFNGINILVPLINRWLMDHVLMDGGALPAGLSRRDALVLCCVAIALSYALGQGLLALSNLRIYKSGAFFADRLRCLIYDKVQNLSVSSIQKRTVGDLMKRVTQDTRQVRMFLNNMGRACLEKLVMLLVVSVILLATNWKLALCLVLPVPLSLWLFRRFWGSLSIFWERFWHCESRERGILHDIIKGIRVVKTFGTEEREVAKFAAAASRSAAAATRNERYWALLMPVPRLAMYASELIMMYLGGRMVLKGQMSLGTLVQFTLFAQYLFEPLRWMARFPRVLAETNTSLIKLYEILDEEPTVPEAREPIRAEIDGEVRFEGVQFGYKPYEPVLKDVTLTVAPNEMMGLVGHSGAGKSTMINLVLRLYDPDNGVLKIGGHDVRDYDYAFLRENIGVVFQETFLFAGTVFENIAYAKPGAAPEEVFRAARLANAHEFIIALPDGYNTFVGEDGHNLSGGERQRVALARVVLKDPKILILDEATSALDPETEQKIQQALERLVQGRTTIAIAHRLSTLRHANRLAVIEQGSLAELGSHRELLAQRGIYYNLVMAQRQMSTK
ncbi:MAG: ABC transporter ATP-binding protein/permease [Oscillospiraceae bacterium]|jgi:ATP-binding cassette subfamily B protein|nr:ABC transporter ATP-binding protein/permease [Oscillospiraceae bacterium]